MPPAVELPPVDVTPPALELPPVDETPPAVELPPVDVTPPTADPPVAVPPPTVELPPVVVPPPAVELPPVEVPPPTVELPPIAVPAPVAEAPPVFPLPPVSSPPSVPASLMMAAGLIVAEKEEQPQIAAIAVRVSDFAMRMADGVLPASCGGDCGTGAVFGPAIQKWRPNSGVRVYIGRSWDQLTEILMRFSLGWLRQHSDKDATTARAATQGLADSVRALIPMATR